MLHSHPPRILPSDIYNRFLLLIHIIIYIYIYSIIASYNNNNNNIMIFQYWHAHTGHQTRLFQTTISSLRVLLYCVHVCVYMFMYMCVIRWKIGYKYESTCVQIFSRLTTMNVRTFSSHRYNIKIFKLMINLVTNCNQ